MDRNIIICFLVIIVGQTFVTCSLPVVYPEETWPYCSIGGQLQGSCENLVSCPQAVQAVYRGLHPPTCYWQRDETFPLVCCPQKQGSLDTVMGTTNVVKIPTIESAQRAACGHFQPAAGGSQSWPWMVTVYKDLEGTSPVSSGFLIDDKHVLTAAQMFPPGQHGNGWSVKLERQTRGLVSNLEEGTAGALHAVKNVKVHEGFRSWNRYDDLALITLEEPVANANPICLPPKTFDPNKMAGLNCTVLGVHRTEKVPIVSPTWCSEVYSKFLPLSYPKGMGEQFFCAGLQFNDQPNTPGVDDLGGPVMTQTPDGYWTAIGLVSLDYKCTQQGLPGVYMNLAHYMDWIEEQRALSA